jgi:hypothetical protein
MYRCRDMMYRRTGENVLTDRRMERREERQMDVQMDRQDDDKVK